MAGHGIFGGLPVGLRKTSLVDYPGKVAAVIFFTACNLRCPWCHNGPLLSGGGEGLVSLDEAVDQVLKRRKVLGGVVLSGGEPTLYEGLPELTGVFKEAGLPVKLDTNGLCSAMLKKLFSSPQTRPDYIALDLKAAPVRYSLLSINGNENNNAEKNRLANELLACGELIKQSGVAHEYRSLALPENFFTFDDVDALADIAGGDSGWHFSAFKPGSCLDKSWDAFASPAPEQVEALAERARCLGKRAFTDHRPQ